jgi:hypothetical protein
MRPEDNSAYSSIWHKGESANVAGEAFFVVRAPDGSRHGELRLRLKSKAMDKTLASVSR